MRHLLTLERRSMWLTESYLSGKVIGSEIHGKMYAIKNIYKSMKPLYELTEYTQTC